MPVPLLKFPLVVYAVVFKSMDHKDIFLTSLTSMKARRVIGVSLRGVRFKVNMNFELGRGQEFEVYSKNFKLFVYSVNHQARHVPIYKIGSLDIKLDIEPNTVKCYWLDQANSVLRAKNLISHISEIFNKPTVNQSIFKGMGTGDADLEIIKWIKSCQLPIPSMSYMNHGVSSDAFTRIMNELNDIEDLVVLIQLPDTFRYTPPSPDYLKIDKLIISGSTGWVNLDDFMGCGCMQMFIVDHNSAYFLPINVNAFLKKWMSTDCQLEYLQLGFNHDFDFAAVVDGLGEIQQDEGEPFVECQGSNDKKATIRKSNHQLTMKLEK